MLSDLRRYVALYPSLNSASSLELTAYYKIPRTIYCGIYQQIALGMTFEGTSLIRLTAVVCANSIPLGIRVVRRDGLADSAGVQCQSALIKSTPSDRDEPD